MELKEAIRKRQSVRDYEDKPVPEEKLRNVLEAARLAPSSSNRQPWKFIVVKDSERRQALARAANNQAFVGEAPVIIAAVATNPEEVMACGVPRYAVNLAIAVDHMTLAAADEGLGTCWIGSFSQQEVREILGIPEKYKVVTIFPLGFPRREKETKKRKSLEEIVCYETFKE
ncbi:nitroreductase family protein [Chloroflexota bacterium]